MSTGIGLSFAAMANLIVEAVPPAQTGEATGFNALTRSVGASVGSQVTAAILAGSAVAGSPLASDSGFTAAFLVCAAGSAVAAGVALVIPRGEHHAIRSRMPALAEH
jgi:sugar phosphate permease